MSPAHDDFDDPGFDDETDPEAPSPEDLARFDRDDLTCPSCGCELYDDASVCPVCSEIIAGPDPGPARKYLWPLVAAAVLLLFLLRWLL